ncbi:mannose-1-phosphate guanylyltransferase [Rufibacter aurantiacus]|uniref:mannose-1-phosphate guanylyltransferase n=1 Tax=Rufibacter aurantiacus TaxID=2817374 RepID=UPI001B312F10|nr:mannose-1-phosphate guanylyltransferase [Rufibacter aurantiacus]
MASDNYVLIMAGGVGSRFWPKSRNHFPKQFIDILGIGKSLLQLTYQRFLKLCPADNIFIVTNNQYVDIIKGQLPEVRHSNIINEPSRNNTAPCIAYASFKVSKLNPKANIVIAPSDHLILYEDVFINKLRQALIFSASNKVLITLGVKPTRPDTGYGYINYSKNSMQGLHKVVRFTEKPALEKAEEFLSSGSYLWNAGVFIWRVSTFLNELEKHCPELYTLFAKGYDIYNTNHEEVFINRIYPQAPNTSIDYAVMEKADNIYTIPAEMGWSDLGTWASLYDVADKDETKNVLSGKKMHLQDTHDCVIQLPEDKLAVIRGLNNYIVVDDGSVLLIYPKDKEQDIKKISQEVNEAFGESYL